MTLTPYIISIFNTLMIIDKAKFAGKDFLFYDLSEYNDLLALFPEGIMGKFPPILGTIKTAGNWEFIVQWFSFGDSALFALCATKERDKNFSVLVPGFGIFTPELSQVPIFVNKIDVEQLHA